MPAEIAREIRRPDVVGRAAHHQDSDQAGLGEERQGVLDGARRLEAAVPGDDHRAERAFAGSGRGDHHGAGAFVDGGLDRGRRHVLRIGAGTAQHQQVGAATHRHQGVQGRCLGRGIGGALHRRHDLLVGAFALGGALLEPLVVEVHDQRHRLAAHGETAGHAARRTDRQVERVHGAVEDAGHAGSELERHGGIGTAFGHRENGLEHRRLPPRQRTRD